MKKYLIKSGRYNGCFQQKSSPSIYSSDIGTAILDDKPKYVDYRDKLIESDNLEYGELIYEEYIKLEREINNLKSNLEHRQENFNLIKEELIRIQNLKKPNSYFHKGFH